MKVLLLDNYDSFTYNLYQYIGEILSDRGTHFSLEVKRNDAIDLPSIRAQNYERIIISPGPGNPIDSAYFGVCADVISELGSNIPILGICLGMQGIAHIFGAKIKTANIPVHGKTTLVKNDGKGVFHELPTQLEVMRYHSLLVAADTLPKCLEATAWTLAEGNDSTRELMGLRHNKYPIEGIQFHPESFGTEEGKKMIFNFLH